jgi:hypothetical protein
LPFRSMRALRLQWSRAFNLVCEVALTLGEISVARLVPTHSRCSPLKGDNTLQGPSCSRYVHFNMVTCEDTPT